MNFQDVLRAIREMTLPELKGISEAIEKVLPNATKEYSKALQEAVTKREERNKIRLFFVLIFIATIIILFASKWLPLIISVLIIAIGLLLYFDQKKESVKSGSKYGFRFYFIIGIVVFGTVLPIFAIKYFISRYYFFTIMGAILYLIFSHTQIRSLIKNRLDGKVDDSQIIMLAFWFFGMITTFICLIIVVPWGNFFG